MHICALDFIQTPVVISLTHRVSFIPLWGIARYSIFREKPADDASVDLTPCTTARCGLNREATKDVGGLI